jgi:hypothetical protein
MVAMKKWIISSVLLVIILILLAGCKVKEDVIEEPTNTVEEIINYAKWEYMSVVSECEIDNESSQMICLDEENNDYQQIDSFLDSYGSEGWELVDLISGEGSRVIMVMKRTN